MTTKTLQIAKWLYDEFHREDYYTFGWEGLNATEQTYWLRKAEELFAVLEDEYLP